MNAVMILLNTLGAWSAGVLGVPGVSGAWSTVSRRKVLMNDR